MAFETAGTITRSSSVGAVEMSLPAQNAFPLPLTTTTRTDGSLLAVANADNKSRDRSLSIAFSFSGRLSDSVNTPS